MLLTAAVLFSVSGAGPFSLDAWRSATSAVLEPPLWTEVARVALPALSDELVRERADSVSQAGIDLFFSDDDTGHSRRLH